MKPNRHVIYRLRNKASQSICKFRVSALAFNKSGVCIMARTNRPFISRKGGGKHAEAILMQSARAKGITCILICRIGLGGKILPIHPCKNCAAIAKKLGIKIITIQEEK